MRMSHIKFSIFLTSAILLQSTAFAMGQPTDHFILPSNGQESGAFHIVVIGDSIAWGNGLKEENKSYYLVADWLQKELNETVDVTIYAHSGAAISAGSGNAIDPNLNSKFPSLMDQANSIQNKGDVDLILASGGINDVGINNILDANTPAETINNLTESIRSPMTNLLTYLLDETDAKIIVTGYYPLITEESKVEIQDRAVAGALATTSEKTVSQNEKVLISAISDPTAARLEAAWYLVEGIANNWDNFFEEDGLLRANSDTFYAISCSSLKAAVKDADKGRNRVIFVDPLFERKNAYRASDSFLWHLDWSIENGFTTNDDLYQERAELVEKTYALDLNPLDLDLIKQAENKINPIAHPNRNGSAKYAHAIEFFIEKSKGIGWLQNGSEAPSGVPQVGNSSVDFSINTVPYSIDFDLHNNVGFDDKTIGTEDIVAFIQKKYPNSPMLGEPDIGNCFINAGYNDINPAFLVALACLEGGFGTLGLAESHPECHNTFESLGAESYYAAIGAKTPTNEFNCRNSWCAGVEDVASHIHWSGGSGTVSQVCEKYITRPNASTIASLMNELYAFSVNRKGWISPQMLDTSTPQLSGGSMPVTAIAFSSDGNKLAASAEYGETSIWDLANETEKITLKTDYSGIKALAFSPDGNKLATGSDDENLIHIWDVASGKELQWMHGNPSTGTLSVVFSPDGSNLTTADEFGTTIIWNVERGTQLQNTEHDDGSLLDSVALSSDGSKLATCNNADRTTRIWDVASGIKLQELEHSHPVVFVAFNFNGSKLATKCQSESELDIWDVASGKILQKFNLDNEGPLTFNSDGKKIATCGYGNMSIWDVASGIKLQTLKNSHCGNPRATEFSLDGSKIAVGGIDDGFTRIWDMTKTITTSSNKKGDEKSPSPIASPATGQNTTASGNSSKL